MTQTRKAPGGTSTFLRFAWQQLRDRKRIQETFFSSNSLSSVALGQIPGACKLKLSATDPWSGTGLVLKKGERFSVSAEGAVWISKPLSVGVTPNTALWVRIGKQAPIKKAMPTVWEAWADGELEVCLKPPGEWANERGDFDPEFPRTGTTGSVELLAQRINPNPAMDAMLKRPPPWPEGWSYLWRLGDGMSYEAGEANGRPCIHVRTRGDVGILQYSIEASLDDTTSLEWRWCIDRLPSALPEHIQPTHDYLSIAVEFDNGQDLTYFWSAELPVDTVFKCPLPWWDKRETHWVVRSGREGLGQWLSEKRNLKADYEQAIGGLTPAKVVRVWLIANSVFQRRPGEAKFADIALNAAGARRVIL